MIDSVFYKDLQPAQLLAKVRKCPVAYIPIGTLEWHGRHLPLGTDMMIPENIFAKVAEKFGGVVFPPLFLAPDIQQKIKGKKFAGMEICGFQKNLPNQLYGNCYHISRKLFYQILEGILENLAEYNESDGDDDEAFYESGVYAFEGDFDVGYCDNRKEFDAWILSKVYEYAQKHGSDEEKIAIERFKRLKK